MNWKHIWLALSLAALPTFAYAAGFDIGGIIATITAFKQPQVLAFTFFVVAGVLVHVEIDIKKGLIKAADSGNWLATLIQYMFKERLMSTLSMVMAASALGVTYLAITPQPISWVSLIIAGATAGYTSDSLFNRGG